MAEAYSATYRAVLLKSVEVSFVPVFFMRRYPSTKSFSPHGSSFARYRARHTPLSVTGAMRKDYSTRMPAPDSIRPGPAVRRAGEGDSTTRAVYTRRSTTYGIPLESAKPG